MKKLSDRDIEQMIGDEYHPDERAVCRAVRADLRLGDLIPPAPDDVPTHIKLDLHRMTQDQAWDAIMKIAKSGARTAHIITGASGILRQKFPQWATDSLLSPYILSFTPINNGSFSVKFKKQKSN